MGLAGATQLVAWQFGYADALGPGMFSVGSVKVYGPWKVLDWHHRYGQHHPKVFEKALIAPCLAAGLAAVVLAATGRRQLHVKEVGVHRWGGMKAT